MHVDAQLLGEVRLRRATRGRRLLKPDVPPCRGASSENPTVLMSTLSIWWLLFCAGGAVEQETQDGEHDQTKDG